MQSINVYCLSEYFAPEHLDDSDIRYLKHLLQHEPNLPIERLRKTVDGKTTNVDVYRLIINDERSILFTTTNEIDGRPSLLILEVVQGNDVTQANLVKLNTTGTLQFTGVETIPHLPAMISDDQR